MNLWHYPTTIAVTLLPFAYLTGWALLEYIRYQRRIHGQIVAIRARANCGVIQNPRAETPKKSGVSQSDHI